MTVSVSRRSRSWWRTCRGCKPALPNSRRRLRDRSRGWRSNWTTSDSILRALRLV